MAPSLTWRLDGAWKAARRGAAARAPAVRVHRRALLAHDPADGGAGVPHQFLQLLEHSVAKTSSCSRQTTRTGTSTSPDMALPVRLPADLRRKILHDNAANLYGLRRARDGRWLRVVVGSVEELPPGVAQDRRRRGPLDRRLQRRRRVPRDPQPLPAPGRPAVRGRQLGELTSRAPAITLRTPGRDHPLPVARVEFDLRTGASWFDPVKTRVRRYEARENQGGSSPAAEDEIVAAGLEKGPFHRRNLSRFG